MKKNTDKKVDTKKANDKKANKKSTSTFRKDDLGKNVVKAPGYTAKRHGWSAIRFRYTVLPVILAALAEILLECFSLWGQIADLINQAVTLATKEHFDFFNALNVFGIITVICLLCVLGAWGKQKNLCDDARKSASTDFYRVKDGDGIVIHRDSDGQKMFTVHGILKAEKEHPVIGRLEVFLGLLKFDLQPLLKRHLAKKNAKAAAKGKEFKHGEYSDVKITFIGGEERTLCDVENPDKLIEYLEGDRFSANSTVTYKVNSKI